MGQICGVVNYTGLFPISNSKRPQCAPPPGYDDCGGQAEQGRGQGGGEGRGGGGPQATRIHCQGERGRYALLKLCFLKVLNDDKFSLTIDGRVFKKGCTLEFHIFLQ